MSFSKSVDLAALTSKSISLLIVFSFLVQPFNHIILSIVPSVHAQSNVTATLANSTVSGHLVPGLATWVKSVPNNPTFTINIETLSTTQHLSDIGIMFVNNQGSCNSSTRFVDFPDGQKTDFPLVDTNEGSLSINWSASDKGKFLCLLVLTHEAPATYNSAVLGSVKVDSSKPSGNISISPPITSGGSWVNSVYNIDVSGVTDSGGSGLKSFHFGLKTLQRGVPTACGGPNVTKTIAVAGTSVSINAAGVIDDPRHEISDEGISRLCAYAEDNAGNVYPIKPNGIFKIDTTAPRIESAGRSTTEFTFLPRETNEDSTNVLTATYSGSSACPSDGPVNRGNRLTFPLAASESCTLTLTDSAGNSVTDSTTFGVSDTENPRIAPGTPNGINSVWTNSNFNAPFTLTDNVALASWAFAFIGALDTCDTNTTFRGADTSTISGTRVVVNVPVVAANNGRKICVVATDGATLTHYFESRVITIDRVAPTLALNPTPAAINGWHNSSVTVNFVSTDVNGSGYKDTRAQVNTSATSFADIAACPSVADFPAPSAASITASSANVVASVDAYQRYCALGRDNAGNFSTVQTLDLKFDTTSPTGIAAQTLSDPWLGIGESFEISFNSINANISGLATPFGVGPGRNGPIFSVGGNVIRNGINSAGNVFTYTTANNQNGPITYTISISDNAGNTPLNLNNDDTGVKVDTTPPIAPIVDLPAIYDSGAENDDNITRNDTLTFDLDNLGDRVTVETDTASVETISWTIDGTVVANEIAPTLRYVFSSDGQYNIRAIFTDAAGNSTPSSPLLVTIDTSAPTAPDVNLQTTSDTGRSSSDGITNDTTPSFIITNSSSRKRDTTASGSIETISWTIDGTVVANATFENLNAPEITRDGEFDVVATAIFTDAAGNSTSSEPFTIMFDNSAPVSIGTPDLNAGSDTGSSDTDDITKQQNPTFDLTFSNATNDLGQFALVSSNFSSGACASVSQNGGENRLQNITGVSQVFSHALGNADAHKCWYLRQEDLAGNAAFSSPLQIILDRTGPLTGDILVDLPEENDSTRLEIVADGEDTPDDDGNNVWNPGKTDDYTNNDAFSINITNVPSEFYFGKQRQVGVSVEYRALNAANSIVTVKSDYQNSVLEPTAAVSFDVPVTNLVKNSSPNYAREQTIFKLYVTDAAGNESYRTNAITVNVDQVSQTPRTPDLAVATDSGDTNTFTGANSDNYTNHELLSFDYAKHSQGNDDKDSVLTLYTWVDTSTNVGIVDESETTRANVGTLNTVTDVHALSDAPKQIIGLRDNLSFGGIRVEEGTHKFVFGLVDKAGNPQAFSLPLTVYVDRTAPAEPLKVGGLNSADDSGAVRPGAQSDEINKLKIDAVTNVGTNLTFFGCAEHSDIQDDTGPGKKSLIVAKVRESGQTDFITDTRNDNRTSAAHRTFADAIAIGGSPIRPYNCLANQKAYNDLNLNETYGANNEEHTYDIFVTAEDRAGNTSVDGATGKFIVDRKRPVFNIVTVDLLAESDNGTNQQDNATSKTDLIWETTSKAIDNNKADATILGGVDYSALPQKTVNHYELVVQEVINDTTLGAIRPFPAITQITDFTQTTNARVSVNGFVLPFSDYAKVFLASVRAVDVAGNSVKTPGGLASQFLLPPPPVEFDLDTISDTGNGVTGTDSDKVTSSRSWALTGSHPPRINISNGTNTIAKIIVSLENGDTSIAIAPVEIDPSAPGSLVGCADEDILCNETNDNLGEFNHTFTLPDSLADGEYLMVARTKDGNGELGAINKVSVRLDTTAPTASQTANFRVNTEVVINNKIENIDDGNHERIGFSAPTRLEANSAIRAYTTEDTPVRTGNDATTDVDWRIRIFANSATIDSSYGYQFTVVDAAGNESDFISYTKPQGISIVELGDGSDEFAAVSIPEASATTNTMQSVLLRTGSSGCVTGQSGGADYSAGSKIDLGGSNEAICFIASVTYPQGITKVLSDSYNAPNLASVNLQADHDTTVSKRAGDAFTSNTSPTIEATTIPNTPIRLFRVTEDTFVNDQGAGPAAKWANLAVDANRIFTGTSDATTGQITQTQTVLEEGRYRVAASITLEGTATDVAEVFQFTIDTTAPAPAIAGTPIATIPDSEFGAAATREINHSDASNARVTFANLVDVNVRTEVGISSANFDNLLNAGNLKNGDFSIADVTAASLSGSQVQYNITPAAGDVEIEYPVFARVTDRAGNLYVEKIDDIKFDGLAPRIVIIQTTGNDFITVALDGTDDTPTIKQSPNTTCSAPGNATTAYASPAILTSAVQVCFSAEDNVGNIGYLTTADAIQGVADLKPTPATDSGVSDTDAITNNKTPILTGQSAPDIPVRVFYRKTAEKDGTAIVVTDADWVALPDILSDGSGIVTQQAPSFADGVYDLGARVNVLSGALLTSLTSDVAIAAYEGNFVPATPVRTGGVTIDTTAPSGTDSITGATIASGTTSQDINGKTIISDTTPSFDLVLGVAGIGVSAGLFPFIQIGTAILTGPVTTPGQLAQLLTIAAEDAISVDGTYTLIGGFSDLAGNRSPAATIPGALPITIDTTAPTFTFVSDKRIIKGGQAFTVTAAFQDSNLDLTQRPTGTFVGSQNNGVIISGGLFGSSPLGTSVFTARINQVDARVTNYRFSIASYEDAIGNAITNGNNGLKVFVDRNAPSVEDTGSIIVDDKSRSNINFDLSIDHNQNDIIPLSETLSLVFDGPGKCSRLSSNTVTSSGKPSADATNYRFVIDRKSASGTYKGCSIKVVDGVGNESTEETTLAEFRIRSSGGGGRGGISFTAPSLSDFTGIQPVQNPEVVIVPQLITAQVKPAVVITSDVPFGESNNVIVSVQKFLNENGFIVSTSGPGSRGQETSYFGPATKSAITKFQVKENIAPTGDLNKETRDAIYRESQTETRTPQATTVSGLIQSLVNMLDSLKKQLNSILQRRTSEVRVNAPTPTSGQRFITSAESSGITPLPSLLPTRTRPNFQAPPSF